MSALFTELPSPLPGVRLLQPRRFEDARGGFVKTYHETAFGELGIRFAVREEYYSVSRRGVIRGMHFQVPPAEHAKLVYCPRGRVRDVMLNLRRSSASYGRPAACELSAENRLMLLLPAGFAHGFLALEDDSTIVYKTTSVHSPAHDAGVRWDSFCFDWGVADPIVSARDSAFPRLADYTSPFP